MSEPLKVVVFLLGTYERTGWFTKNIVELAYSLPYQGALGDRPLMTKLIVAHNFTPAAGARNKLASLTPEMDPQPDWICMIDNDISPPPDILNCLRDAPEDAAVIVPRFFLWDESKVTTALCWGVNQPDMGGENHYEMNHVRKGFQELC